MNGSLPRDLLLEGRVAVVTGAASGIGLATARRAAQLGARVAVLDLVEPHDEMLSIRCDVASPDQVAAAFAEVRRTLGPAQILVNNAGVIPPGSYDTVSDADFRRTLDVNLAAAFCCSRHAVEDMRELGRGAIVNVSSMAARYRSIAGSVAYAASKGGLLPLTFQLAYEVSQFGIRVNCVCPGAVQTGVHERNMTEQERQQMLANIPLKRAAGPDEIAAVICFLASDAASYMTGAVVDVNGGVI